MNVDDEDFISGDYESEFFVNLVMARGDDEFTVEAILALPWSDKYANQKSEMYQKFALNFKYYVESMYRDNPVVQNSSILVEVARISKAYERREDGTDAHNPIEIVVTFNMTTVNFSIDRKHVDMFKGEIDGNHFDKIFKWLVLEDFELYLGDFKDFDDGEEDLTG